VLPRFADKSAQNLIDGIERSKTNTLARFLYSLGILHVGEYAAKLLAQNFKDIGELYHITTERITDIKQMGEKIADSVSRFFNDQENLQTLESLIDSGVRIANPDFKIESTERRPLEGMTFVITGTVPESRKDVENLIERMGGHTSRSVSKNTSYLVLGDAPGSKLKKAQALGIKSISYDELMTMMKGKGKLF
jgi:DNA ligase (NAD+)